MYTYECYYFVVGGILACKGYKMNSDILLYTVWCKILAGKTLMNCMSLANIYPANSQLKICSSVIDKKVYVAMYLVGAAEVR